MFTKKLLLNFALVLAIFQLGKPLWIRAQELVSETQEKRDPFIPLIDDKGDLRKNFKKPLDESMIPQVTLMGISKVNKVFYAIIDGEWVKEGDTIKDLKIGKIESDKVILEFAGRIFVLTLEKGKKQ